jgi:gliding motility-associated-like protein
MDKLIIACCVLIGCADHLKSQDFYIIDTLYNGMTIGTDTRSIIDINTCELSTITTDINPIGVWFHPLDMTVTGESGIGIPISLAIDDDPTGNNIPENVVVYNFFILFGTPGVGPTFFPETAAKALATDYNFESYLVGDYLSHIDDINDVVTPLGMLPPGQKPKGQMTFREGSFYYPSVNNELIQIKVAGTDFWMRSLGSLPDTINYGGVFSIPYACDSTDTYVIHHNPDGDATIYHLAIPSLVLTQHCTIPNKPSAAAHDGENTLPDCSNYALDLDLNNPTELNRYDSLCTGTISLLDNQIQLSPDLEFDSITITLQNPIDNPNELLSVTDTHPEVVIDGQNSERITLASTGFTKAEPLLEVLASLNYTNNTPTLGQRIIEVVAFHPYYGTVTAFIYLEVTTTGTANIMAALSEPSCFSSADGSIDLNITGTESYALIWDNGDTDPLYPNLSTGTYSYQLTDDAGCMYNEMFFLDQPDTLTLTITALQDTICGPNGMLTGIPVGGTPDYSFAWSSGAASPSANMLSTGTYDLVVTDANNCTANASYTLYATPPLNGQLEDVACLGQTVTINNQPFTQDTTFQQLLTTPAGCDSLLDVQLTFFDTFYTFSAFEICPGESINLYDLVITQDTNFTVALQTVNGCDSLEYYEINLLNTPVTPSAPSICAGESYPFAGQLFTESGVYYDTLQAATGCDSLVELTLTVHALPTPAIVADGSLCNSGAATLATSLPYASFSWSDGTNGASIGINTPGSYAVTVTDDNDCSGATSLAVTDNPPIVDFAVEHPACPDGVGVLQINEVAGGSPPYLLVETGQEVFAGTNVNGLAPASYTYTLQDANGCLVALDFSVMAENTIAVDLPPSLSIKQGESILLPVNASFVPGFIEWSPPLGLDCADCLMPLASPTETTRYFLSLADDQGCNWEGSTLVEVAIPGIYIPNVFSPNDDGNNDQFGPIFNDVVRSISVFSIFDRWGAQIFTANDQQNTWDGRMNGTSAAPGIYVYFIEWVDLAGNLRKETGEVLLLR